MPHLAISFLRFSFRIFTFFASYIAYCTQQQKNKADIHIRRAYRRKSTTVACDLHAVSKSPC